MDIYFILLKGILKTEKEEENNNNYYYYHCANFSFVVTWIYRTDTKFKYDVMFINDIFPIENEVCNALLFHFTGSYKNVLLSNVVKKNFTTEKIVNSNRAK